MLENMDSKIADIRVYYRDLFHINQKPLIKIGANKVPIEKNWTDKQWSNIIDTNYGGNWGYVIQNNVLVIDVDPRNFPIENGVRVNAYNKLIRALGLDLGTFGGNTFVVKTGNNGYHFYFSIPAVDFKIRKTAKAFPGVEFKVKGQYVMMPGSTHPITRNIYKPVRNVDNLNFAPLPAAMLAFLEQNSAEKLQISHLSECTHVAENEHNIQRYVNYLESAEPAVEGCGGDDRTFETAAKGRDFGLEVETTLELMLKYYNNRCLPPWDAEELAIKVVNAYRYAINHAGNETIEYHAATAAVDESQIVINEPSSEIKACSDAAPTLDLNWSFDRNHYLKPTLNNILNLFKHWDAPIHNLVAFNERSSQIVFDINKVKWADHVVKNQQFSIDYDLPALEAFFEEYYMIQKKDDRFKFNKQPSSTTFKKALYAYSKQKSFDPVQNYFDSLIWDGVKRLDTWLIDICGVEDNPYTRDVGRKILTAAVARTYDPGCKFDHIVVLEGAQGIGKSTLCRILGGEYYKDVVFNLREPRFIIEAMRGSLIVEFSELAGKSKYENDAIKQFLSCSIDNMRLAYRADSEQLPRRCVFFGTVNLVDELGYLSDTTGNRRFWPVTMSFCDFEKLKENRDQLFAEAIVRYNQGEKLFLDNPQSSLIALEKTNERMSDNPYYNAVVSYINDQLKLGKREFTTVEFLEEALHIPVKDVKPRDYRKNLASQAFKMAGLGLKKTRFGRVYVYKGQFTENYNI